MTNLRPFISYASADRDVADRVARHLTACGILPIYDIWCLRQMPGSDVPSSYEEIKMGINHSNAFVYFDSMAARQSPFVKFECELYQLMPNKNDLAMAILSTHKRSRRFKDWFSHEFPEFSEMMNTHSAEEKLHAALIPVAQKILQGTQLYTLMQGADRPY